MLTETEAKRIATENIAAWNSHDLERILAHYDDDVVLISPVAKLRFGAPGGEVRGKAALRAYFSRALEKNPDLRFELVDVMWGISSVVLYYKNQRGSMTGEVLEIGPSGLAVRVLANYGAPITT
ncbi:MAG TPA: nuclear transport factor 2 family protein [Polyangiaceae bacterium]|jgi:hypothetical protein|nr:nuclear transport factor 2 family protein [Polyangiaceae bacterium]